jgi:serine/threonine protein kinase
VAKRFQREALAPAQIGHANVADVTDCGTTPGGEFFFVMEFIDGVSLDAVIKRDGQLDIERALTIAAQICRALEAAHRAGIIHRDLKPSNVMLVRSQDQEELVKVLDFGVAKFLHDTGDGANLTLTDATVGTPKYMAPEQIRGGGKVDFRSDIYALGAILYTMLAGGRLPIEGASVEELWQHKLTRDAYPLREYRSDLPPDLEELVLACLARDAMDRPNSAIELKKRLLAHLEAARATSDSILGMKSPSQTEILSERVLRRRARVGMILGTLTAVLVAVTGMYFVHRPSSPPQGAQVQVPAAQMAATQQPPASPTPPPPETSTAKTLPSLPTAVTAIPSTAPNVPAKAASATHAPSRHSAKSADRSVDDATSGATSNSALPKGSERKIPAKTTANEDGDDRAGGSSDEATTAAVAKAEAAFSDGRMASASISATEAVAAARKASPELKVRAFIILGKVELASEEFAEAERTFGRALAIDPNHPVARKGKERAKDAAANAHQ